MNYAFLGKMIPDTMKERFEKYSFRVMSDAANALQWHLYDGLCINLNEEIRIINLVPVGSYPQYYKKAFIKKENFSTAYCKNNLNVGFCNVKLVRNYFQRKNTKRALLKWCKESEENRFLFVYTMSAAFMSAVESVKKRFPSLKVCAIVADLPNMSSLSSKQGILQRIFQKKMSARSYSKINAIDAFVLLTRQMADYMRITQPYCVVEGISTKHNEEPSFAFDSKGKKTILYTGTLHKRFGVMNLVEAFKAIKDESYELVLCGVGDAEEEIIAAANEDGRIKFLGQKQRNEVLELQKKSSVLVNPRQNIEEFTKYSFPSKNLEYLSSGRPLVGYKLDGIPDEYENYIFYVENNSIEALTSKLEEVCNMPVEGLVERCKKAYEFVQENKNQIAQTKIIIDMLKREGMI